MGDAEWLLPRMLKGDPDGNTAEERQATMAERLRRAPQGVIHYCADVKENGENGFRRQVSARASPAVALFSVSV